MLPPIPIHVAGLRRGFTRAAHAWQVTGDPGAAAAAAESAAWLARLEVPGWDATAAAWATITELHAAGHYLVREDSAPAVMAA